MCPGASVPQPFGGRYRQIMVYVDPLKLEAHQLSVMDVVRTVNDSNLILPAGDVKIGPFDYNLYANSQIDAMEDINRLPLKTVGNASVLVADVGKAKDASQIQNNIVRVDGQPSVYLPVLKQGGDANTIAVVDGIKDGRRAPARRAQAAGHQGRLRPVVFVQQRHREPDPRRRHRPGADRLMILVFLGSMRATVGGVPFDSAFGAGRVHRAVAGRQHDQRDGPRRPGAGVLAADRQLGGRAGKHLPPHGAGRVARRSRPKRGGKEVALPVLAATLTTAIVFFPVTFLYGVSRFLFTALALAVVLSLFASYFVAMTVVPLFCAKLIKGHDPRRRTPRIADGDAAEAGPPARQAQPGRATSTAGSTASFSAMLDRYEGTLARALVRPAADRAGHHRQCSCSAWGCTRWSARRISRAPTPASSSSTSRRPPARGSSSPINWSSRSSRSCARSCRRRSLRIIVSNIGMTPGFSSIYTPNSGPHTAFVQVGLKDGHSRSSFAYMDRVRQQLRTRIAAADRLFPDRRPGGRRPQPRACRRRSISRSAAPTWRRPTR